MAWHRLLDYPIPAFDMSEIAGVTSRIVQAVDLPVIADAEDGFYSTANLWRTVRHFEDAGASAIHIDDHVSGKHSLATRRVLPEHEACARIAAALTARRDPDFLIIARTDIGWATGDAAAVRQRIAALSRAGAQAIMVTGTSVPELAELRRVTTAAIITVASPTDPIVRYGEAGVNLVIFYDVCLQASFYAVGSALHSCWQTINNGGVLPQPGVTSAMEQLLDYPGFDRRNVEADGR
jgi:methylisocitrate lyase